MRLDTHFTILISIHALREEGDTLHTDGFTSSSISIHALREEGDYIKKAQAPDNVQFLSTPSARRATPAVKATGKHPTVFLSTPSARRATNKGSESIIWEVTFLSTPSARRATYPGSSEPCSADISIHALREEGDCIHASAVHPPIQNFYPRPPRGGRPSW